MRDKIKKKLKEIGGGNLQINENSKSVRKKQKDSFISIVTQLRNVWEKSNNLQADHGVNLVQYEDQYYKIIECLIYELYGDKAAEIIMWWVYDVDNPSMIHGGYTEWRNQIWEHWEDVNNHYVNLEAV